MTARHLPDEFVKSFGEYGPADAAVVLRSLAGDEPSVAVRANGLKGIELIDGLEPVPWHAARGAYLDARPLFAADPAWHQGLYYVQDASSMAFTAIVGEISKKYFDGRPLRYLDACAAPGGKTIAAIEGLPAGSLVAGNEYDRQRLGALAENTAKHGSPAVLLTNADAAAFGRVGPLFDIVAVDAPCSGEGMFRKEEEALRQWSPSLVGSCAAMQRRIVDGAWLALRGGGVMLYSTCTFNPAEDEEMVRYLIDTYGAESLPLSIGDFEGVRGAAGGFDMYASHFYPGLVRGEGLFVAALLKPDDGRRPAARKKNSRKTAKIPQQAADFARRHISGIDDFEIVPSGTDSFSLLPKAHLDVCAAVAAEIAPVRMGVPLGTVKGRDFVPAWQLAYSTAFDLQSMPAIDLPHPAALHYLHGESLADVLAGTARGFVTVNHKGRPMGFAKNIGRRANNLLPQAVALHMDPSRLLAENALSNPTPLIKY